MQYNPCPTNQQQNPGCGKLFPQRRSVTSKGVELGLLWRPLPWVSWYNSVSISKTSYDQDLNWCTTTCVLYPTAGKQQVDTPKQMVASVLSLKRDGFFASLQGKYTGRRYYTLRSNDQSFPGVTTSTLASATTSAPTAAEWREAVAERHQPDRQALCVELRQQRPSRLTTRRAPSWCSIRRRPRQVFGDDQRVPF